MNLERTSRLLGRAVPEREERSPVTTLLVTIPTRDRLKTLAKGRGITLRELTEAILLDALDALETR